MRWLADLLAALRRGLAAARLEAYRTLRDRREARGAAGGVDSTSAEGPTGPDPEGAARPRLEVPAVTAEVAVYFADPPASLYQLRQWLPVFAEAHGRHPVAIVVRSAATEQALAAETDLPVVLARSFRELGAWYEAAGAAVCLYVNHHHLNFLSLAFTDLLHVHLNHGESDKVSMASNQAKAYDYVVVAGDLAAARYRRALLAFDDDRLLVVGRPQLDLLPPSRVPEGGNRTVAYAPTWEGGRNEMDYSSVASMGEKIVDAVDAAGWRLIYRPHPRVGDLDTAAAAAHGRIRRRLTSRAAADAGHRVSAPEEPVGEVLADAEVLVADVSSVLLDSLATGRPAFVTRPPGSPGRLPDGDAASLTACYPLTSDDVAGLGARLEGLRDDDPLRDSRAEVAARLFGDTTPGVATRRFLDVLDAIVAERARLVADRQARRDARPTPSEAP